MVDPLLRATSSFFFSELDSCPHRIKTARPMQLLKRCFVIKAVSFGVLPLKGLCLFDSVVTVVVRFP